MATRAELARKRRRAARVALHGGVLESFTDLPDEPAVHDVLARVRASTPDPAFLDRLDLWLILAEDSPGVEFSNSPDSRPLGYLSQRRKPSNRRSA